MNTTNTDEQPLSALIYCRVSGIKQAVEGHGLESQESRCRDYARDKGYLVEAVFPDDVSGGGDFVKRPGMVALLAYLKAQPDKNYVVIFDDLKRFARDTEFHFKLRRMFAERGARVECLNFRFEDSPEGKFIETIIAAQGELERQQNGRQVLQKMKARMQNGYWCFHAPYGYKFDNIKGHGKILVRDEPMASVITEALEGYASGRLASQSEVKRFLESQPIFPKNKRNEVPQQRVVEIFDRYLYAGVIHHPRWDINYVPGQHKGLVSLELFQKIQERRQTAAYVPARKDISSDFPLRGFVACSDCNKPYTACWSKGKNKKYPYYLCDTKGCISYRKSIPRQQIEDGFVKILQDMKPSRELFKLARAAFKSIWNQRSKQIEQTLESLKSEVIATDKQIQNLLDRIMSTTNTTVITAYEKKINDLELQMSLAQERLGNSAIPKGRFEDFIEHALNFLANPYKLWESGKPHLQSMVLRLAFSEHLAYCRKEGYRTPKTSLPFRMLGQISTSNVEMVHRGRFELPTP
ncbi:recombinase family protein [Maritalea sp.]|uniref:recombinase family protein n=1 Tax=Maritalea sp. TaxID=2003361 RepID=UPI003EF3A2C6